jgi:hypothetical protein
MKQGWHQHKVTVFNGSFDTKINTPGQYYDQITLVDLFNSQVASEEKIKAPAFIPSNYCQHDARSHEAQRANGQFVALTLDIDSGNMPLEAVEDALRVFAGEDVALLIYSSSRSSEANKKWRGILPLAKPAKFDVWNKLQRALFVHVEGFLKCKVDWALNRAGQPVYLPNVPTEYRAEDGTPKFYRSLVLANGEGLGLKSGIVEQSLAQIKQLDEETERNLQAARAAAQAANERRKANGQQSGRNIIDAFNSANSIEQLLMANAYEQKGSSKHWRSPYQTSGSFATMVDGDHWISMSQSDTDAGLGAKFKDGCFGDAFDIFCHFNHGGDVKAAIKALAAEAKADQRKDMTRFEQRISAIDEFGVIHMDGDEPDAGQDEPTPSSGKSVAPPTSSGKSVAPPTSSGKSVATTPSADPQTIIDHVASIRMPDPISTDDAVLRQVMDRMDTVDDLNEMMVEVPKWVAERKGLDAFACEMLAGHYKKNMKRLGATISIKSCRDLMQTKELLNHQRELVKAEQAKFASQVDSNEMLRDWVYLTKHNAFFNLRDGREIDSKAFDIIYASAVPILPGDDRPQTATRFFAFSDGRSVYHQMYVPSLWSDVPGGQFFQHEQIDYLNSYMGNKLPAHCADWDSREHWKVVRDHIYKLMSSNSEAQMMIDWMAHNVQKPGLKILWAPVILGPQGAGKTTIERIMSAVMGQQNVRTIALDEVYSAFTGWAEGACVRFIEEIRIAGHSRHDVMNKLKPYLTNERVTVVRKGRDGVDVLNTQNYACFTNHEDAIVLDMGDRRYGVFRTEAMTRQDVEAMFNDEYWAQLYNAINNHAADIRGWLLAVDLSQFNRVAAPPMTDAKLKMIEATRAEDEVNTEIVIQDGAPGVTEDVVSTSHLNNALKAAGFRTMMGSRIHKILAALGFVRLDWTIKFDGKNLRFHVRKSWLEGTGMDTDADRGRINERIREVINKSLFDNDAF